MRILLTGGSGTIGKEVLELLSKEEKYQIIAFDLDTKQSRKIYTPYRDKVTLIYGDITQKKEVEQACMQIDFVIHLAAIIPPLADKKPVLAHRVNVIGTQNLIHSLERYSPQAFFLYGSSISVYGDRLINYSIKVTDELQPSKGDQYAKTKIQAEKLIRNSQLSWSIYRLSAVMGVKNHKVTGLMFHMPLSTKIEIITPKDAAKAFVNSISKKQLINKRIFNLGGGKKCRITYEQFLKKNFLIMGLGALDFPAKAFAEKNFHCGYYDDGMELENILKFQDNTIEDYFEQLRKHTPVWQLYATTIFRKVIKKYLLRMSEPFQAFKENNKSLSHKFFRNV